LVATIAEHLFDFDYIFVSGSNKGTTIAGFAVEITKLAPRNANVGNIDIPVDLPGYPVPGDDGLPHLMGNEHQLRQGGIVEKE